VYVVDDDDIALFITEDNLVRTEIDELKILSFNKPLGFIDSMTNLEIEQPDILIIDINMPLINGFEVIDKIKLLSNFNHDMKIHMQSTSSSPSELDRIKKSKTIKSYYTKYITTDQFKEIIKE
ncbi:MAG: response regulator, partial [Flavobacteriales bacterium]|nr:response regulator [Flavobacteriales bacterium]